MRKFQRLLTLVLVAALALAVIGGVSAQDDKKVLRTDIGPSDVPTLDPAIATDSSSIQILDMTYIGVTFTDEASQVQPGLATDWTVTANDDGTTTYVFNLIPEVPWVKYNPESGAVEQVMDESGAVRYVTAGDFVYGWKRTLDPATAGEYAYLLAGAVAGGEAANSGEGSLDDVGVRAIDDYTLEVIAPNNWSFNPARFGLWMARPQPQWVIDEFAEFWIEPANFVSFGPFALKEWPRGESITIIKNPFWPGTEYIPVPALDEVVFYVIDETVALARYEAGELDRTDTVAIAEIPRIQADPVLSQEFFQGNQTCTYYAGFSVGVPPLDNVHLRRALSYAIDRQDIVENVTQGGQRPAEFVTNTGMNAAPLQEDYPGVGIGYDPDKAQEELALALADLGLADASELPPITVLYNTSSAHQAIFEAIQAMWADELGVQVELTNQEFATYLDQRSTFPVWRAGWCSDYSDAHNFLFDVFHSSSDNNDTGWTSEAFDALVEQAAAATDLQARRDLYAQAEGLLVNEDAAIAPIYFYASNEMTKPYVERTYANDGKQRFENWDINN
ncbi:MAG: peptide ABC transporter substrate-binding protein [Anaerolineae bacterium]|nr:peptide ABC transporter substrate-binding protein [Anaerolineae bacterium]NUQ06138.1 peptide ABC transporter substrate-binding protein [Anaerolineae bacterium]